MGHGDEHSVVTALNDRFGQSIPLCAQNKGQTGLPGQGGVINGKGAVPEGQGSRLEALLPEQAGPVGLIPVQTCLLYTSPSPRDA